MRSKNTYNRQIRYLVFIAVSALLSACGGGGGGGGGTTSISMGGNVLDGNISGATVCLDINGNGRCDSGEPSAITDVNGAYSFSYPSSTSLARVNVIVNVPAGAIDSDNPNTPIAAPFQLAAPASNPSAVTPLTSLVVAAMSANTALTPSTAATQVTAALGLPASVNLFQNYLTTPNTAMHNVAQVVNVVLQNSPLSGNGTVSSSAFNATLAMAQTYTTQAYSATTAAGVANILNTATVAASNGALLSTVPAPSYTQTEQLAIYNQLSTLRANSGAGLLVQNAALDQAAASHAAYLVSNNLADNGTYLHTAQTGGVLGGHYESVANTGFTGAGPQDRATAAGYTGSVNEIESFGAASGQACFASLENSVYHLINLISPSVDLGLTFNAGTSGAGLCTLVLGLPTGNTGQYAPAGSYAVYPYDGQTGVAPKFYNQAEFPTPAADLSTAGHPIIISLYNQTNKTLSANQVVVHSFTLTKSGGISTQVRVLAGTGVTSDGPTLTVDTNVSAPGFLVAVPLTPLAANTSYTVSFAASVNQTAVVKSWTFTTGAEN